ncbi:MAG: FecR family protein [Chromatiales bacterium]
MNDLRPLRGFTALLRRCALPMLIALGVSPPSAAQTDPVAVSSAAGNIELVEGEVSVTAADGSQRTPRSNETLLPGDTVSTGDGELQASMEDGGFLAVRPNTAFRIDAYRAEGEGDDEGLFTLLEGAVRTVTGFIAKVNPDAYRISTPVATIGVRGTDYEVIYIAIGQAAADETPGTHARVYSGTAVISTAVGILDVPPGLAGYVDARTRARPKLHKAIPRFIKRRAGRHDAAIEQHSDRIREHIEKKLRIKRKLRNRETIDDYFTRARGAKKKPGSGADLKGTGTRQQHLDRLRKPERPPKVQKITRPDRDRDRPRRH